MAQIKVTSGYRGRKTQEQWIATGVYDENDPKLFGLAEFLVETDRAHWIGGRPEREPSVTMPSATGDGDQTPPARDNFEALPGIGKPTATKLYELEIFTFDDLANSTAELLADNLGIGVAKAQSYIDAALVHLESSANG